jgi:soluble lytic murein transglycosylase-like protein
MKTKTISILLFFIAISLCAEIVVKYDKDGKIVVSNRLSKYDSRNQVNFKNSSHSSSIPSSYLLKIKTLSKEHKLREDLIIAVIKAESSFNPYAVSKKGAIGLMQLMPDTARQYGVTNRFDVNQNLKGGITHLKYLYRKYNKNLPLTLAAYNAGEKAVKNHNGIPPYLETHNYIKRTMKHMGLHYSGYLKPRPKKKLFKYITKEGRIVITDLFPAKFDGNVEIIE